MASNRIILRTAIGLMTAVLATAGPAFGQSQPAARGRVVDDKAKPAVGAQVTLSPAEGTAKPVLMLTDIRGEWSADRVPVGKWNIEVLKFNLVAKSRAPIEVTGSGAVVDAGEFKLAAPQEKPTAAAPARGGVNRGNNTGTDKQAPATEAQLRAQKKAEIDAKFKAGDNALSGAQFDDALAKFMAVSIDVVNCAACFAKVGDVYLAKSDLGTDDTEKQAYIATAEKYYKNAIEIEPDNPGPYAVLASLYNRLHRMDDATQMSAKANELAAKSGAGGNADALYNQGVIFWNQQKAPEAQAALEKAIAADPKMADGHYLLGMVLVNQGKLAEAKKPLAEYLKLEPKGAHATEVKALLDAIK
jgi:tetratricopeptide (TPR) repeat protein